MTLRNSVIIRVCIQRPYKIFQTKGKKIIKSTYLSCCLYNLWFYVVWRGFRAKLPAYPVGGDSNPKAGSLS